jgi:hypothetical protein
VAARYPIKGGGTTTAPVIHGAVPAVVDLGWFVHYARRALRAEQRNRGGDRLAMTTFDRREEAFEAKFARDEELRFKAMARRNRLLGLWAAEKLGMNAEEADAYAKALVVADFQEAGDEDVFRKVHGDFQAAGVQQSDADIRRTMTELLAKAVQQLENPAS